MTRVRLPSILASHLLNWHIRYVVRVYLQHVLVIAAGLIITALCIDVSAQMSAILDAPPAATGIDVVWRILWYLSLRSVDIGTKLLPVCCFLGVLSAEAAMTLGRERLVIWGSGRTPFQCVMPALLLGIVFGCALFSMDVYLRPLSMAAQAAGRLGEDGERYSRTPSGKPNWFAAGDRIVSAVLDFGPPPRLSDVMLYQVSGDGHLLRVVSARSATPQDGSAEWRLEEGRQWSPAGNGSAPNNDRVETFDLGLNPVWLSQLGLSPMYLPQPTLRALAGIEDAIDHRDEYRMWLYLRYNDLVLPACMMLLASSLALAIFGRGFTFERVFVLAMAGYSVHVLIRAFTLLGGQGKLAPGLAAFLAPALALLAAIVVLVLTHLSGTGRIPRLWPLALGRRANDLAGTRR